MGSHIAWIGVDEGAFHVPSGEQIVVIRKLLPQFDQPPEPGCHSLNFGGDDRRQAPGDANCRHLVAGEPQAFKGQIVGIEIDPGVTVNLYIA
jgi:hypothetical protein